MAKKLKLLKGDLKIWNKEVFRRVDIKVKKLMEEVRALDEKEGIGGLEETEAEYRNNLTREVNRLLISEEICWRRKSRVQWLKEGDRNTKYFHRMTSAHKNANFIRDIWIEDRYLVEEEEVLLAKLRLQRQPVKIWKDWSSFC